MFVDDTELIQLDDDDDADQNKDKGGYYGYDFGQEYRRFQPKEQRETVILNHRKASSLFSLSLSLSLSLIYSLIIESSSFQVN